MAHCEGCGTDKAIRILCQWPQELGGHTKIESCDRCDGGNYGDHQMRDAAGQPVSGPSEPWFSTAAGRAFSGKREFSEYLRSNGLAQNVTKAMNKGGNKSDWKCNAPKRGR